LTIITISSPLGMLQTTRDPVSGAHVLPVDGVGVTAGGVVYYQPEGASAGEAAVLAVDPASGAVSVIKETT
jgi:hypothetical protein